MFAGQRPPRDQRLRIEQLGLGAALIEATHATSVAVVSDAVGEARTLRVVLAINAVMFVGELAMAWFAQSAGLLADSLDMFTDAAVYGLALYAVGRSARTQPRTASRYPDLAVGALIAVIVGLGARRILQLP